MGRMRYSNLVRERVLDMWSAGIPTAQIMRELSVSERFVRDTSDLARSAGDPRAITTNERRAAMDRRNADLASGAITPGGWRRASECTYARSRECGIEPTVRQVPNGFSLGSTGPAFVDVSVARLRCLERPLP